MINKKLIINRLDWIRGTLFYLFNFNDHSNDECHI